MQGIQGRESEGDTRAGKRGGDKGGNYYYYKLVKTFHQKPKTQVPMWPPQFFNRDKHRNIINK